MRGCGETARIDQRMSDGLLELLVRLQVCSHSWRYCLWGWEVSSEAIVSGIPSNPGYCVSLRVIFRWYSFFEQHRVTVSRRPIIVPVEIIVPRLLDGVSRKGNT